nr:ABC transporter permease [Acidaminococcus timonensis]
MRTMKSKLQALLPFVVVFLLWKVVTDLGLWSSYILPSPQRVWETTVHMVHNGELVKHIAISLRRILWGFLWAFVASCVLSSLNLLFPHLRRCYSGLLEVFRHVPPLSLIPLLILWFGIGELPKTIIIVLASFFPMYLNMDDGFRRCDKKLLEVGQMLGFSPWQTLWQIRLPAALPGILTGLRVGMGYSLRAIIGAEMIAADSGLGYLILDAQAMSRSDKVIIGILAIGAMGLVLDGVFALVERRLLRYERN